RKIEFKNLVIFVEVELKDGRKIITLRSGLKIINRTTVPWEMGIISKSGITQLGIVQPDDSIGVPNSMIAKGNFVLKPANNNDYEWSQSISETSILELMSRSNRAKIIECPSSNPMESRGKAFYCILYLKMEDPIQYKQRA